MHKLADYLQVTQHMSDIDEILLVVQNLLLSFAENQQFFTVQKILTNITQTEYENTLQPILEGAINEQQHIILQHNKDALEPQSLEMILLSNSLIPYQQQLDIPPIRGKMYNSNSQWIIQHLSDIKVLKKHKSNQQYQTKQNNNGDYSVLITENEQIQISVQDLYLKTPINPFCHNSDQKHFINILNQIQKDIYLLSQKGIQNIIVSSPTGTGKTVTAILFYALHYEQRHQAAFVAPTHALCQQFYDDFQKYFPRDSGLSCCLISDKIYQYGSQVNQHNVLKHDMIICTYEKLDVMLNNLTQNNDFKLSCLLIDEIHNVYDDERGSNLESLLIKSKLLFQNCAFFGVSGTLTNKNNLQEFLNAKLLVYGDEVRPVPITTQYQLFHNKSSYVNRAHMQQQLIRLLITDLVDQQVIIFVQSQKQAQELAQMIANIPQLQQLNQNISQHQIKDENLGSLIRKRVAYHHSAVDQQAKQIIENLFKQKEISVIVSTQTLAQGVNLPAKNVIIYGNMIYDNTIYEYRCLNSTEIQQMAGRAGRRGLDSEGSVYCLFDVSYMQNPDKWQNNEFLETYVEQLENPIEKRSQLSRSLLKLVNDLISILEKRCNQSIKVSQIQTILNQSLYYYDIIECGTNYDFNYIIKQSVELLVRLTIVKLDNNQIQSTELGRLARKYYMQPQEAATFQFYIQLLNQQNIIQLNGVQCMNQANYVANSINQQHQTQFLSIDHNVWKKKHINIWIAIFNSFSCLSNKIKVNIIEMHQWRDSITKFCGLVNILTIYQPYQFDKQLNYDFMVRDLNYLSSQFDRIIPFVIEVLYNNKSTSLLQLMLKMKQRHQIWKMFQQAGNILTFENEIGHLEAIAAVNNIQFQKQFQYVPNNVFYQHEEYFIQNDIFPEDLQYIITKYPSILQEKLTPDELYLLQDIPFLELEFIYIQPISCNALRIQFKLQVHNNSQTEQYNCQTLLLQLNDKLIFYKEYKQEETINVVFTQQVKPTDVQLQIQVIYQNIGFPLTKIISLKQIEYIFVEQKQNVSYLEVNQVDDIMQFLFIITDNVERIINMAQNNDIIIQKQEDITTNSHQIKNLYVENDFGIIFLFLDDFIDEKNQLNSNLELFIILLKRVFTEHSIIERIRFIISNKQIDITAFCNYMEIPLEKQAFIYQTDKPNKNQQHFFLESRLDVDLINVAEQIRTQGTIKLTELLQVIEDSFFFFRLVHNPLYYNFENFAVTTQKNVQIEPNNLNQFINAIIEEIVDELGAEAFE